MADAHASVVREGDALVFRGVLDRAAASRLWKQALASLDGVHQLDLAAVDAVDSAGMALLAELAGRVPGVAVCGTPTGLSELRAAYRLGPALGFGTSG